MSQTLTPPPANKRWKVPQPLTPAMREKQKSSMPTNPGEKSRQNHSDHQPDYEQASENSGRDEESPNSGTDTGRISANTNLKITQESLCFRMGFTTTEEHSDYRSMLRQAKKFCTMIDFDVSWESNDPEARESEIDRLHDWWGSEFNFPLDLTRECLKVCCGWPMALVPGDKIPRKAGESSRQYRALMRKLTPDSLQYRMGFTSETTMHRTAYLRRRQKIKDITSGVNWLIPYSHQHETVRRTSLDRVFNVWGPEFGYSRELCKEVIKTLCANGSSVAGRASRAEHRKANPNIPLKRGRKPRAVTGDDQIPSPATPGKPLALRLYLHECRSLTNSSCSKCKCIKLAQDENHP